MKPGDIAPDFELTADDGRTIRLYDELAKGPVVLFFYPKAMTPGCTAESCHFRDLGTAFEKFGATRIGVSADPPDKQQRFSEKHSFDFRLLSDIDRAIARAFEVKRPGPLFNRRTTFVIDTDGRVLDVIHNELNMDVHADRALAALESRATHS
jgi:peroxiredoxin Q/BCP